MKDESKRSYYWLLTRYVTCLLIAGTVYFAGMIAAIAIGLMVASATKNIGYALATGVTVAIAGSINATVAKRWSMGFVLTQDELSTIVGLEQQTRLEKREEDDGQED